MTNQHIGTVKIHYPRLEDALRAAIQPRVTDCLFDTLFEAVEDDWDGWGEEPLPIFLTPDRLCRYLKSVVYAGSSDDLDPLYRRRKKPKVKIPKQQRARRWFA